MNPRQIPFLRMLLPWAAGIAAGAWRDIPLPGMEYGLCAGGLLLIVLARQQFRYAFRWIFGSLLAVFLLGAGYWRVLQQDDRRQATHFSRVCPSARVAVGTVCDAPSKGAKQKVPLRVEACGPAADSLRPCTGNLLLFLDASPASGALRYGDRLWVQGDIRPCEPPKNPHAFDYRQYLHIQNMHYQVFAKDRSYGVIATGLGHPLWRVAFRWRVRTLDILRAHFPGIDEYAVAAALLLGYKDELPDELQTAYAETGSMHALAVSGTHVGLLYAGLLFLFRRIPWAGPGRRWVETALVLASIWAFTLVTGASASVLRASVMFSVFLTGKAIRRQASIWNVLAVSAFGLLFFNPYLLFDAGFQLSYAAVAGMVLYYPKLQLWLPPLPKWVDEGWKILLIGVAAQLGTLPLSLYYFHQFPVYFWLAGWVVVLGGAVFLWGGAMLVLLDAFVPVAAAWLGKLLYGLVWGMNYLVQAIQQLPGAVISGVWINGWAAAALYGFILLATGALLLKQPRWLLVSLVLLLCLGGAHSNRALRQIRQREIVLYHVSRHFLLDFFDGRHRVSCADSLSARQERFAAQANRWAHGIAGGVCLGPNTAAAYRSAHLLLEPPFVQFFEKKLALIDASYSGKQPHAASIPVDAIILHNNPGIEPDECLRRFPSPLVVFASNISRRRADRWKAICREKGVAWHDVQEQGAWVLRF